ncbi:MAG: flavohemo protein b5/b5R-like protein [Monoraphidium minutum]|nr:MAG: flavohemo protein b5/b5R-like protein [Monoraphidium minutum]
MADFTFPTLGPPSAMAEKAPLTAKATVTHAGAAMPAPAPVAVAPAVAPAPAAAAEAEAPSTSKPVLKIGEVKAAGRRNKVPLEKGFSQVDWLRLSRSGADLRAGLGLRKDIPMEEVRQHAAKDDAWMVLSGRVYNITPYMAFHPGGAEILMAAAGKDGTALFQRYHPWVNGHALLEACLLGAVKTNSGGRSPLGSGSGSGSGAGAGGGSGGKAAAAR